MIYLIVLSLVVEIILGIKINKLEKELNRKMKNIGVKDEKWNVR